MLVIGLLGGVASGKSLVGAQLASMGAMCLDADRVGHEVLLVPSVREKLRERFGETIFDATSCVDRKALGRIVFQPTPQAASDLKFLESVTHPLIGQRLQQEVEALQARGVAVAVLDAPVMLKAGWDKFCDRILFVEAPQDLRRSRALARGWTEADFAAREAAQESLDEKRARADLVIDNSGSAASTRMQVERYWRRMVG